jgi:hypothetical protein
MTQSYGSVDETSDSVEWDLAARSHLERSEESYSEESDSITRDTRALQSVTEIPVVRLRLQETKTKIETPPPCPKKKRKKEGLLRSGRVGRDEMVSLDFNLRLRQPILFYSFSYSSSSP